MLVKTARMISNVMVPSQKHLWKTGEKISVGELFELFDFHH